ncbi:MAG: RNase adapter RapZ [Alphaproteobacteria bacterium]|nr:RNase adapter RapZ [Alphaproteobacteria bacterium]
MNKTPDPQPAKPAAQGARLVVVTGLSGAGKTSALKALEDIGYEAVDNLPLPLLSALVGQAGETSRPLAIGVDIRTRDFSVAPFIQELDELIAEKRVEARLIFLDCDDDVLQQRFTETRRRHPLAADRPLMDGIRHERSLLARLRGRADAVIDTTDKTLAELQATLEDSFDLEGAPGLTVFVTSFAYGRGLPREADLVFDARFLKNPYYQRELRPLTGEDDSVGAYIRTDPDFDGFFQALTSMLEPLLPRYEKEGKSYLTIAIGCTGGRHRSVYIAECLTEWLNARGQRVNLRHRDARRPPRAQKG